MQNATWAIFYHSGKPTTNIKLDDPHRFCPIGENSWCKFNADKERMVKTYNESKRLPSSFYEHLEPLFQKLSSEELPSRCLKGLTQNANESINHSIWNSCPNETFCSKVRIMTAVSEAVSYFNTGAGA